MGKRRKRKGAWNSKGTYSSMERSTNLWTLHNSKSIFPTRRTIENVGFRKRFRAKSARNRRRRWRGWTVFQAWSHQIIELNSNPHHNHEDNRRGQQQLSTGSGSSAIISRLLRSTVTNRPYSIFNGSTQKYSEKQSIWQFQSRESKLPIFSFKVA